MEEAQKPVAALGASAQVAGTAGDMLGMLAEESDGKHSEEVVVVLAGASGLLGGMGRSLGLRLGRCCRALTYQPVPEGEGLGRWRMRAEGLGGAVRLLAMDPT